MKRLVALILVALTFAFTSVAPVAQAAASPSDTSAGKPQPQAALDAQTKGTEVTAASDKADAKVKKVKKHGKAKVKKAKKDAKEANENAAKEATATKDAAKKDAK